MNKYHARKVTINGIKFDSEAEGRRYLFLKSEQEAGRISDLECHPKYALLEPFECRGVKYRGIKYIADFEYIEDGNRITEDVKGMKTQVFRLKEKLFLNRYGNEIEFRVVS